MNRKNNMHKQIDRPEWLMKNSLCKKAFSIYSRVNLQCVRKKCKTMKCQYATRILALCRQYTCCLLIKAADSSQKMYYFSYRTNFFNIQ